MCSSGSRAFGSGMRKKRNSSSRRDSGKGKTPEVETTETIETAAMEKTMREAELFSEFKNTVFTFSSGAGAWMTELQIREDGSFWGQFEDTNMGETGGGVILRERYISLFSQAVLDHLFNWTKTAIRWIFWK